jgi:hypothetical protein
MMTNTTLPQSGRSHSAAGGRTVLYARGVASPAVRWLGSESQPERDSDGVHTSPA